MRPQGRPRQRSEDNTRSGLERMDKDATRWKGIVTDKKWKAVIKMVIGPLLEACEAREREAELVSSAPWATAAAEMLVMLPSPFPPLS